MRNESLCRFGARAPARLRTGLLVKIGRRVASIAWVLALLAPFATSAATPKAEEALYALLKSGGRVVLMRHAITTMGLGDPPGVRIGDCSTQRNLTEEGRRHAKRIGEALRANDISMEKVLSSPMCRCLDTARLVFGRIDVEPPESSAYARNDEKVRQVREMRALASDTRRRGNVVLVSHESTIRAVTELSIEPGEMVVVTPKGEGRFEINGRLMPAAPEHVNVQPRRKSIDVPVPPR